ncbi:DUF6385 domain-containing protein [Fonticella tunisiensis]|nr:DUF6385 domain-containing protein [Fonticella tunisiensis]
MAFVTFKEKTFNIDTTDDSYTTPAINTSKMKDGTFFVTNLSLLTDLNVKIQASADGITWVDDYSDLAPKAVAGPPVVYNPIAIAPLYFAKYYRLSLESDPPTEVKAAVKFVYQVF